MHGLKFERAEEAYRKPVDPSRRLMSKERKEIHSNWSALLMTAETNVSGAVSERDFVAVDE
jgi:hypothetical protein